MTMDRIEKRIILKATRERVWRAIADAKAYGTWFGVDFEGPFVAGAWLSGAITPTKVDPEVAKLQEPHAGKRFQILVETVEPMSRFAFRWHPYAIDPQLDYSKEPTTLVTFELADSDQGVVLTITEQGFDQIPAARRSDAYKANDGGWTHQTRLIEKFLAQPARP